MKVVPRVMLTILSILVAGIATWYWVKSYSVSVTDVRLLITIMNWWVIPLILLSLCFHVALSGLRWARIETLLGGDRPKFGRAYATGAFALGLGTFLPGPVANVLCRGFSNRLFGTNSLRGAVGGGLDQISDFILTCAFVPPALLAITMEQSWIYPIGCGLVGVMGWLAIRYSPSLPSRLLPSFLESRFAAIVSKLDRQATAEIFVFSLARFVNLSLITVFIHLASGAASISSVLIVVPLVTVAISVAMLPGSLGVSEWSFSGSLAALGVPTPEIAIFVLANRLVLTGLGLVVALTGFFPMLRKQIDPRLAP